ncbi:NADH-ubiquinone oxidoreductase 64 kDa subunit [Penicillium sp. IBT 35674x]|nr:NADH-ubiquinone oxidoreductase 64 kDa subunit [Penicillium sp. IBT 35674x]
MYCLPQESTFKRRLAARPIYTGTRPSRITAMRSAPNIFVKACAFLGFCITATGTAIFIFFLYDSSTYRGNLSAANICVPKSAIEPRRGGPKNLPIADHLMGEYDSEGMVEQSGKPRLVILGTGWGSVALLKRLRPGDYHVTVISPTNYFLFTPMLPSATMGTTGLRSLVEPVRRIVKRLHGHFLKATADDVLLSECLVEVSQPDTNGELQQFYVPYDKLVVAVGTEVLSFPKSIDDARDIRNKVLNNIELACLPTTRDEERKRLLSFLICGGGPTGVEFAAELFDLLSEDLGYSFPKALRNEISVHVIQSRAHILNTYDEAISKYTESHAKEHFARDSINILVDARVNEVQKDKVLLTQTEDEHSVLKEIPMGFCLWSTGVSRAKLCKKLSDKLPEQNNKRALETDPHLRLIGSSSGEVYAIGDCSTVQNDLASHIVSFLRTISWEKGKDPEKTLLTFKEWTAVARLVKERFPQADNHLRRLDKLFEQYEKDHTGMLGYDELYQLLHHIDTKLTSLPATAQRANQQGVYLGRKLSKIAGASSYPNTNVEHGSIEEKLCKPFRYKHLGSLAYIGNAAVFNIGGYDITGGILAVYLWRSVYLAQSVGLRTKCMLAVDWVKRGLFGRGKFGSFPSQILLLSVP